MADRYLLESGSPDGYLLEDGTGVLLMEEPPPEPTILFDAITWTQDDTTHAHVPVGVPTGVLVFIATGNPVDHVTSVTYGGDAMTEVTGSPLLHTTGETGAVYCYFLGTSIPTGNQTVTITNTGMTVWDTWCITVTGTADTVVKDVVTFNSDALADPTDTLTITGEAYVAEVILSGHDTVGAITPFSGWTARNEDDLGAQVVTTYTLNAIATSDTTVGWTQASNDATSIAIAIGVDSGDHEGTSTLAVTTTLSATGVVGKETTATVTTTATLTATGSNQRVGEASPSFAFNVTAEGLAEAAGDYTGTAARATTADVTTEGVVGTFGSATRATTASLTATGVCGKVSAANAVSTTVAITATGVVSKVTSATRTTTATITASGIVGKFGSATLTETFNRTAEGVALISGSSMLIETVTLEATGTSGKFADAEQEIAVAFDATATVQGFQPADCSTTATIIATSELFFPVYFTPPTSIDNKAESFDGESMFFGRQRWNQRGQTVIQRGDSSYIQVHDFSADLMNGSMHVYLGGRKYHLTPQERDDLTAAGYGSGITVEP